MLAFESALVLALMALSSAAVWLLLWRRSTPCPKSSLPQSTDPSPPMRSRLR